MQEDKAGEEKPGWSFSTDDSKPEEPTHKSGSSKETYSWTASEYIQHHHGIGWYLGLAAASIALAGLLYISTKSIFSASVAIVLGVIVGISASRSPKQVTYQLDREGISIADKDYPYSFFKSFSIIDEGGLPSVMFLPIKRFMPPISAYFAPEQYDQIIKVLGDYLPFEKRGLDLTERIAQRLRF